MNHFGQAEFSALVRLFEEEWVAPPFLDARWLGKLRHLEPEAASLYGFLGERDRERFEIKNGVAVIDVSGPILHRDPGYYYLRVASHERIRADLDAALAHPDVEAICGRFNTYGGTATGCPELAAYIFSKRGPKPMWAVVDSACYSAGYFLASAFDKVILSISGGLGSIGCVGEIVSYAEWNKQRGIDVHVATSGTKKALFHPDLEISDEAKAELKASVERHGGMFIDAVARHRKLSSATVRGFQAGTFEGQAAIDVGLADELATFEETIAAMQRPTGRQERGTRMETETKAELIDLDAERKKLRGEIRGESTALTQKIKELCAKHDVPAEYALNVLANPDMTLEAATAEIERIADVRGNCLMARSLGATITDAEISGLVARGLSSRDSGKALQDLLAAKQSGEIASHIAPGGGAAPAPLESAAAVTERLRREAMAHRYGDAVPA